MALRKAYEHLKNDDHTLNDQKFLDHPDSACPLFLVQSVKASKHNMEVDGLGPVCMFALHKKRSKISVENFNLNFNLKSVFYLLTEPNLVHEFEALYRWLW